MEYLTGFASERFTDYTIVNDNPIFARGSKIPPAAKKPDVSRLGASNMNPDS